MLNMLLRDLAARIRQPLLWALAAGFVVLSAFFFLLQLEHYQQVRPLLQQQVNPSGASDLILVPWTFNTVLGFMVLVPMLAGRAFFAEYRQGLLPVVLGWPLPVWQWLLARWLGWLIPLLLLVFLLAAMPLGLAVVGPVDTGRMLASVLALALSVTAFTAVAVSFSAWIRDPGLAALATFLLLLLLWILDWSARGRGEALDAAVFTLSLFERFRRMNAGLIHMADVAWFFGFTGLVLALGAWRLAGFRQGRWRSLLRGGPWLVLWVALMLALGRTGWVVDPSWQQRFSLQPATRALLERIGQPVYITAWVEVDDPLRRKIEQFLAPWQRLQPLLQLHFRDPAAEADRARDQGIRVEGTLVLRQGERQQRLERALDEPELASALWRLLLQGHGPVAFLRCAACADPADVTPAGLSLLEQALQSRGLRTFSLDAEAVGQMPRNTGLLIVPGPAVDLSASWWANVSTWLESGGSLLWLADVEAGQQPPVLWQEWGLKVDAAWANRLLPPEPAAPTVPAVPALPGALTWKHDPGSPWTPLWYCRTRPCALAREQILADGRHSRVLLLGDSDLVRNRWLKRPGYLDGVSALTGWLLDAAELFTLPVRRPPDAALDILPEHLGRFGLVWLFGVPGLLLLVGFLCRLKPCKLEGKCHA